MNHPKFNPSARRWSRRLALQAMYQWQLGGHNITEIAIQFANDDNISKSDRAYFDELLHAIPAQLELLDQQLLPCLEGRKLEELDPIELAILRMAAYELTVRLEIPYRVVINEAVELAKNFGAQESFKYINGVLDKLARKLRVNELKA